MSQIGDRMWFWPIDEPNITLHNDKLPCDAVVFYCPDDKTVDLKVTDHAGGVTIKTGVRLADGATERPTKTCATHTVEPPAVATPKKK